MRKLLFIALLFCLPAFGQVTVSPFVTPNVQFLSNSGTPLANGKVCTFAAGSTTPQTSYSDSAGSVANTNPVVLDSAGRASIWLTTQTYKIVVAASTANSQCSPAITSTDNVSWATIASTVTSLVDTGALTVQASAAATSGANQSSPLLCVQGNYWTGAASASDKWCLQDLLGTGSNPTTTLNVTHGAGSSGTAGISLPVLSVTGASTLSSVNTILYPTRGANSGSATGGIQEAITSLAGTQGMVFIDKNVTSTAAINMAANVDVVCAGKNVSIVFTGATDGFVWPNTANNSSVRNCTISAGNAASGKAINISDVAAAATNVKISDVLIASNNAPTTKWAYGYYCSNGIFETFDHVYIQTATIAVHGDGTCNANDFVDTIINENLGSLTTAVEWQGGELRWTNGDIEGQFSNALAEITQPGASGSTAIFTATRFENHTATGKGVHANVGKFDCYGCRISIDAGAVANGFVIGDTNQTNDCKVVGGEGIGWTLGANASGNLITGYTWDNGITPVDNSAIASNNVFGNHAVGAGSTYAAEQMQEPIRAQAGTVAIPAYSFAAETGAGFYRAGANNIGVAFAGTEFIRLSNLIRQYSGGVVGWTSTANSTAAADTGLSRCGVATVCVGNGTASDSSGTINAAAGTFTTLQAGTYERTGVSNSRVMVANDFTTANNANLQNITGLSWTFPATAGNYSFHCGLFYSQAGAAVSDTFGIQAVTNAPTQINAGADVVTSVGPPSNHAFGILTSLSTTTATAFVTFTPGAITQVFYAYVDGSIELGASANTVNIMVQTSNGADAITIKRGSYCVLY